ncbi:MAG: SurA N-terminal domain-containing protein [Bacteroidales bacterium]|nr:SurA N-terminal domain-containing protein [Bacteroidales bacterium]
MAVLEKMRGWGIVLSILVAVPLLMFVIDPSQVMQTIQSTSSKYDVGKIGGQKVTYTDFQNDVDRFTKIGEVLGGGVTGEQQQKQAREAAWQELIDRNLFVKNARAAGINVGKDEMHDLINGDMVSPIVAGLFSDETGSFSNDVFLGFLEQVEMDETGRLGMVWNYLQNSVNTSQYYQKYNALFTASAYQNALELNAMIAENNNTANVEFVMVPLSFMQQDSTVVVSNSEIKKFYNANKDRMFKQIASREVEYVVFEVKPSDEDIAEQNNSFASLWDEFSTTENLRSFLQLNSDKSYSDRWYKAGELNSVSGEVEEFVASHTTGTSPVIMSGNTLYAARIIGQAQVPDSVQVRHIMLRADQRALADSILSVVKPGNFEELAGKYSLDQNNRFDGELGNLGWMTQNNLLPGFEAAFTAKAHAPFIATTDYGIHVVEVTKTSAPIAKKQVAIFQKEIVPSSATHNTTYNQASRFAAIAGGKLDNFQAAQDSSRMYAHPMTITEATESYGAISHAKEITRWAFDNRAGKVSNVITVDNKYFFVVAVKEATKEGYMPLQKVAADIQSRLYSEKYAQKRASEIAAEIEGLTSLEAIAEKLETSVSTQNDVAFSSMASRSLDPKFLGAIASAKDGEICGPVAGSYGVYVFRVTERNTGAYYTEDDARSYQRQLMSYTSQMILPIMMEEADVKDNRARFY